MKTNIRRIEIIQAKSEINQNILVSDNSEKYKEGINLSDKSFTIGFNLISDVSYILYQMSLISYIR